MTVFEKVERFMSSKGFSYGFMTWIVFWGVFDLLTGNFLLAGLMGLILISESFLLRAKFRGTHRGYNKYYSKATA